MNINLFLESDFFIKRIGALYWENTDFSTWIWLSSFKILKLYLFNVKIKWNPPIYVAFLSNHRGIPTTVLLDLFRFRNGIIFYVLSFWNHRNPANLISKYPENPQLKHINFVKWRAFSINCADSTFSQLQFIHHNKLLE